MIVITDISALEVWNALDSTDAMVSRIRQPDGSPRPSSDSELGFVQALHLTSPIHLLVPQKNASPRSESIVCHISDRVLPDRSLLDMQDGVFVASPEFAYLQMARRLSRVQAQVLAMELCGGYTTIGTLSGRGFIPRRPVSKLQRIHNYLKRFYSDTYAAKILAPLNNAADNSASPMETIVELLLCESYRFGGYGIPVPEMNARIPLTKDNQAWAGKSYYECDLLWPDQHVAIEYDSDMFHSENHQITRDAIRRNMLEHTGTRVITLTSKQVRSPYAFEGAARQLSKALGKRIRLPKTFLESRDKLRRELLARMPWQR